MSSQEQEIQETSDSESLTDDSVEGFEETPVEDSVETSSEAPVEDSEETSAETPVEDSVEASAETPVEASVETSEETPVEDSEETSAETPVEDSEETSSETPVEDSVEASEETPVEESAEPSAEIPEEDPVEISPEATVDEAEVSGEPSPEENPVVLELQTALGEVEKFKDMAIRAEAEMQNVRRRAERDVENAHKFGLERILTNFLPIIDGLEKALESAPKEADPVIDGVRLTFKLMQNVLEKESVEVIDPLGEPFNPNEHEAISVVENPDMEPNSVCLVIQKGYKLNQRLVRPAMVMVTRAPVEEDT